MAIGMLPAGTALYRVHGNGRGPVEFNGSGRGSGRFSFFRAARVDDAAGELSPIVPVLYAAETEQAAVAETLLHDVDLAGGVLTLDQFGDRVLNRIVTKRPLLLGQFHGLGLRQLRVAAAQLTDTNRDEYHRTVRWAAAAHAFSDDGAPVDGVAWMSKRCNSDRAYMFFGGRVTADDFDVDRSYRRVFAEMVGAAWLSDLCAPLGVDVLTE